MDLDLIGGSPRLGKPYSMLERRTFGCDETIANEPENGVNYVQVWVFQGTFKIDPVAILSFRLFLPSAATASAAHAFIFPAKLLCLGGSNSR
jgi:hypothetical protein